MINLKIIIEKKINKNLMINLLDQQNLTTQHFLTSSCDEHILVKTFMLVLYQNSEILVNEKTVYREWNHQKKSLYETYSQYI